MLPPPELPMSVSFPAPPLTLPPAAPRLSVSLPSPPSMAKVEPPTVIEVASLRSPSSIRPLSPAQTTLLAFSELQPPLAVIVAPGSVIRTLTEVTNETVTLFVSPGSAVYTIPADVVVAVEAEADEGWKAEPSAARTTTTKASCAGNRRSGLRDTSILPLPPPQGTRSCAAGWKSDAGIVPP